MMTSNIFNLTPQNLQKWRTARAQVSSGQSSARIMCIGDSTTYGFGSNYSTTGVFKPLSYPTQLSNLFNKAGINAHANSFFGCGASGLNQNASSDGRLSLSGTINAIAAYSLGGSLLQTNSGGANIAFTPTTPVDTFNVWYTRGGNGTFSIDINGSGTTNVNSNGSNAVLQTSISGSLGSNTLNFKEVSGGTCVLNAVEAYDSSKKWLSIMNAGWCSSSSVNWAAIGGFPWDPITVLPSFSPDLTIINLGINDWNNSVSISTFLSNIQAIITAAQATGDVILVTPTPSSTAAQPVSFQNQYVSAIYQLARTNNLPLIDIWNRWVSYADSNALGLYNPGDTLHPNGAGYNDQAQFIFDALMSV